MDTLHNWSYLRQKIREWSAGDMLPPQQNECQRQFSGLVASHLEPLLLDLKATLGEEGIQATLQEHSEDYPRIGLWIEAYEIDLAFVPNTDPRIFQLTARRHSDPGAGYERRIPYRHLDLGRVRQLVQELLLRLLGPRRFHGDCKFQ
ncbi:MAG: hypothetical protein AMXMBFR67_22620 [Nitrospira sp.]